MFLTVPRNKFMCLCGQSVVTLGIARRWPAAKHQNNPPSAIRRSAARELRCGRCETRCIPLSRKYPKKCCYLQIFPLANIFSCVGSAGGVNRGKGACVVKFPVFLIPEFVSSGK